LAKAVDDVTEGEAATHEAMRASERRRPSSVVAAAPRSVLDVVQLADQPGHRGAGGAKLLGAPKI
jgi:hypothetical protein